MPWCPKCKTEYIDGITKCADCNTPLVDTWEEIVAAEEAAKKEAHEAAMEQVKAIIEQMEQPEEDVSECEVTECEEDADTDTEESEESLEDEEETVEKKRVGTYVKPEEMYSDTKSSGYMLVVLGVAGIIALVLVALQIIPLSLDPVMQYIFYAVLGILFIAFIGLGINALKKAKEYKAQISVDDDLSEELLSWITEDEQKEKITGVVTQDMTEDEKYFEIQNTMQKMILEKQPEISEEFLDYILELAYQKIFE